jgi:hypothetical protein
VTPVTFVLIVSAIVSGHGQTIAARQDSLTACIEAKVWYESLLAHHGVRPLASKCQAQMRFTILRGGSSSDQKANRSRLPRKGESPSGSQDRAT